MRKGPSDECQCRSTTGLIGPKQHQTGKTGRRVAANVADPLVHREHEELAFWATHTGAEVDLFWQEHGKNWGVDLKYADAPRLTPSMAVAVEDLELDHLWVVYPGDRTYALAEKVSTLPLAGIGDRWSYP